MKRQYTKPVTRAIKLQQQTIICGSPGVYDEVGGGIQFVRPYGGGVGLDFGLGVGAGNGIDFSWPDK